MNINLFDLEPEKIYGLKANEDFKQEKINRCVNSNNYVASLKKDGQYHRYVNFNGEIKKSDVRIGDLAFINKYPGSDGNHVGICVGFLKNGEPLIAHCSATQNKVVVSTCGSEFKYFRRPCSVLTAN